MFADEKGKILKGEEGIIFFLRNTLPHLPGGEKFVYDLKCSQIVPQEVKRMGGIPIPERSGHAHIKRRLLRENAFMAGEISGHYFFRELKRDDGLYAAALFLYYLSRTPYPLSQIRETFPPSHITPDIRIAAKGREDLLPLVENSLSGGEVSYLDGIRVEWEEGWAMIRKSVTEPVYTLRFEGKTSQDIPRLVHRFLRSLPEVEEEVLRHIKAGKKLNAMKIDFSLRMAYTTREDRRTALPACTVPGFHYCHTGSIKKRASQKYPPTISKPARDKKNPFREILLPAGKSSHQETFYPFNYQSKRSPVSIPGQKVS